MKQQVTSKQYFKTLTILFYALIIGQIIMIGIAFLSPFFLEKTIVTAKLQMYIILLVSFICIFGFSSVRAVFKNKLKQLSQKKDLVEKMQKYQNLTIAKYATLEGCSFCAAIATFLTGDTILLTFSLLMLMLIFVDKPSCYKAMKDLNLSSEDARKIQNPEEIISIM